MKDFIVVESAIIQCKYGSIESIFLNSVDHRRKIENKNPILDNNLSICDYLFCSLHKKACKFEVVEEKWKKLTNCKTTEGKYITTKSVLFCKQGGLVSIVNAGQYCMVEEDGMLQIVALD